ncbi:MAG: TonB-dependent receptor [Congregibacter sp.]
MYITKTRILALTMLGASTFSSADNRLEEVVITSSRVPTPLREVGTSISVITEEEIRALGFNSLHDVLRTQPSVGVSNTGGAGAPTSLRIRGEEGFRTRVFIDGNDIADASGVQISPRFEHLLSSSVSRVEILRGPQGLMYGADAGGVINIQTLGSRETNGGTIGAEVGRFDTRQLSVDAGGRAGGLEWGLNAADYETDGINSRTDDTLLRDSDGYENTSVHGALAWNVSETLRLSATLRNTDAEGEYDNCFTASFSRSDFCDNSFEQLAWRLGAEVTLGRSEHSLAYSANETERAFFTEGVSTFATEGEIERLSYTGQLRASNTLKLVFGTDLQSEQLDSGSDFRERDQNGYYLEAQSHASENLYLTAGLRYDDNDDFGEHTTYRLSAAYLVPLSGGELKFKAAYGTGFRAPSLSEEAYNAGPFAFPPASTTQLEEEESEGLDIGVVWASDSGSYLEATLFDQRVSNEIFFDLVGFSGYQQASGEIQSRGLELVAMLPLAYGFSINSNYTYNDTERSGGGNRLRRPEHLANLNLQWRTPDERISLALQYRGSYDAVGVGDSPLDDFEVLTLNANWQATPALALYGRVENLLDEDYEEVPGFRTAGAALYAGLRYGF